LEHPTSYPAINACLERLLLGAREALGERFVGLYLCGSLAAGGFSPLRSDIDFLVVTDGRLPDRVIDGVEATHLRMWSEDAGWASKLEGVYLPEELLPRYDARHPPLPKVNEGRFYLARPGPDAVIQRYTLREHETIVSGPSLRDAIYAVRPRDLRWAVRALLRQWWAPMIADPARPKDSGYQPYAVLSMCRALHTLERGTLATKSTAARWARDAWGGEWAALIERALSWQRGDPLRDVGTTLDLIRCAVEVVGRSIWPVQDRQIGIGE
jgi:hypothetical protein